MPAFSHSPLAITVVFPWMNLVWVLVGITVFICVIAAIGRYLAATHPDPVRVAAANPVPPGAEVPPDVAVIIAAAVYAALGDAARVTAVVPRDHVKVNVENLMLQWSLEGRREIYSSHRVR